MEADQMKVEMFPGLVSLFRNFALGAEFVAKSTTPEHSVLTARTNLSQSRDGREQAAYSHVCIDAIFSRIKVKLCLR